jgi:hypothetical protein
MWPISPCAQLLKSAIFSLEPFLSFQNRSVFCVLRSTQSNKLLTTIFSPWDRGESSLSASNADNDSAHDGGKPPLEHYDEDVMSA